MKIKYNVATGVVEIDVTPKELNQIKKNVRDDIISHFGSIIKGVIRRGPGSADG